MQSILYSDFLAAAIARFSSLLAARTEPIAQSVTVANKKTSGPGKWVVLTVPPGSGTTNTIRQSFITLDVYADDEGEATDLANFALALLTSSGPDGMANGSPFTRVTVSGGPNPDFASDETFRQTAELDVRHRGTNLT